MSVCCSRVNNMPAFNIITGYVILGASPISHNICSHSDHLFYFEGDYGFGCHWLLMAIALNYAEKWENGIVL